MADEQPEVLATQAALDHAQALGIDLAGIVGSGKDGKVLKADVEAAVALQESPEEAPESPPAEPAPESEAIEEVPGWPGVAVESPEAHDARRRAEAEASA